MSEDVHRCPGIQRGWEGGDREQRWEREQAGERDVARLAGLLCGEPWLERALSAVAASGLPDAWIGAGVVRDVVWGQLYGEFRPDSVRDVDVAYFDPADLSGERDAKAQETLAILADLPWEATNQAAVHTWYHRYFGGAPVEPFGCVHDAIATWPETATCVAVRRRSGAIEMCAPHGLADLLGGVWRVNPVRVTPAISRARLARQRAAARWPGVTVVPPG
jgi:uncharacterized protein